MTQLSIVATLYQSGLYIQEFYERVSAVAKTLADDYEIVLVNDGSPDNSLGLAIDISKKDNRVTVVDLSRNFGHHKAIMTGLANAKGEKVFLIDSDLEESPEWLLDFSQRMIETESDVVYGVQRTRKGRFIERYSGEIFYSLFRFLTRIDLPRNFVTARLMSRRYVKALLRFDEREIFLAGLWHITGFVQTPFTVDKDSLSATTYTFSKRLSLLVNSVTSFSNMPLKAIFYFGLFISFFALVYISYLVINWGFGEKPLGGWTSVMASIWLLGGLIISFIGVVGVYLSKVFSETKRRPYTIIRHIYGQDK